jgi:diaminopimelate epimerase
MERIPFHKMSGSGNDFIIIDNRQGLVNFQPLEPFVVKVCRRKMSVGADGLILIEASDSVDFKWRFYNSDGSRAEMCGNGARCAARYAYLSGISGSQPVFETDAGRVSAEIIGERVKVRMTDPSAITEDLTLALNGGRRRVASVNTGVPHVVLETDDLEGEDVLGLGREIRRHEAFAPAGTNVNFMVGLGQQSIAVRTYERGVEDETLACGTGSIAAALVAAARYGLASPIDVRTRSGISLTIHFQRDGTRFSDVYLEGDARVVYTGQLWLDAWQ